MVCDRCKMAVEQVLSRAGLHPESVELGVAKVRESLSDEMLSSVLKPELEKIGFELLDDKRQRTIEHIKTALIKLVHLKGNSSSVNLSDYLQQELNQDYSALSKLFSEVTSQTIEHYYIELRIERVKELLTYDELTLNEIALTMNYSSAAYLSSQFKAVTGMTPSAFKRLRSEGRRSLDSL
jgi:AraC family transcriptional regulator